MKKLLIAKSLFLIVWIVPLLNFTCHSNSSQETDGGPCAYLITNHPAKILNIEDLGNNQVDLNLEINPFHSEKSDTISYCLENQGRCVSMEELKSKKLNKGDTIIYQIHDITEGACNPQLIEIKVEKYKR